MNTLGTIREFNTKHFRVIVDAVEDDSDIYDLHLEPNARIELVENLNSGKWILFCARARVFIDDVEIASDYLGGCIYPDMKDFEDHRKCGRQNRKFAKQGKTGRCGSYFSDMIGTVCSEARKTLQSHQSIKVRG